MSRRRRGLTGLHSLPWAVNPPAVGSAAFPSWFANGHVNQRSDDRQRPPALELNQYAVAAVVVSVAAITALVTTHRPDDRRHVPLLELNSYPAPVVAPASVAAFTPLPVHRRSDWRKYVDPLALDVYPATPPPAPQPLSAWGELPNYSRQDWRAFRGLPELNVYAVTPTAQAVTSYYVIHATARPVINVATARKITAYSAVPIIGATSI